MGGAPAARGARINCEIFTTLFWRLNGLNVATTRKRSSRFWEKKSAPLRKSWLPVWEKGPALRWYGAPEWLIQPWLLLLKAWTQRSVTCSALITLTYLLVGLRCVKRLIQWAKSTLCIVVMTKVITSYNIFNTLEVTYYPATAVK